jgi:hypothetical protein
LSGEFAAVLRDIFSETPSVRCAAVAKLRDCLSTDVPVDDPERVALLATLTLPVLERLIHLFCDGASSSSSSSIDAAARVDAVALLCHLCSLQNEDGGLFVFAHKVAEAGAIKATVCNLRKETTQGKDLYWSIRMVGPTRAALLLDGRVERCAMALILLPIFIGPIVLLLCAAVARIAVVLRRYASRSDRRRAAAACPCRHLGRGRAQAHCR